MLSTKIVVHSLLSTEDLLAICELKYSAWPYSMEKQKQWIKENIKRNDSHLLLFENDELVAYMNLVQIKVFVNSIVLEAYGIGNVCSKEKAKGYGGLLMNEIGKYLTDKKAVGLLFCKNYLIEFYLKYSWFLIDKSKIDMVFEITIDFNMMCYNLNPNFNTLEYKDRIF